MTILMGLKTSKDKEKGEKIENPVDHPILRPSLNSVKATYDLAQDPQYEDLMTATSMFTGEKVNRFLHIHQNTEDLIKKVKMQRLLGQQTDPKGDRGLPPHAQEDPDMYLHVVERRPDGIVVRGAKAHQTGAINSQEMIVMPTIAMGEDDKEYAVAFAVPMDAEGIIMIIGRQSCDTRKLEGSELDVRKLLTLRTN